MFAQPARAAFGYISVLVHAAGRRGLLRQPAVRDALIRQIHMTGVQPVPFIVGIALLFGAVVVARTISLLGPENDYVLNDVVWGGIRELGPLVTALIVIARSGIAIAAEVGLMQLRTGISDSVWLEAAHEEEVVLPRVLGVAAASAILVAFFQVTAIGTSLLATAWTLDTPLDAQLDHFLSTTSWSHVPLSILKGAIFGLGIAAIACYHGLKVTQSVGQIPKAVVAACLGGLAFVFIVDLIAALL